MTAAVSTTQPPPTIRQAPWRVAARVEPGQAFAVILPTPQSNKDPLHAELAAFFVLCKDVEWDKDHDTDLPEGARTGISRAPHAFLPSQRIPGHAVRCWVRP